MTGTQTIPPRRSSEVDTERAGWAALREDSQARRHYAGENWWENEIEAAPRGCERCCGCFTTAPSFLILWEKPSLCCQGNLGQIACDDWAKGAILFHWLFFVWAHKNPLVVIITLLPVHIWQACSYPPVKPPISRHLWVCVKVCVCSVT